MRKAAFVEIGGWDGISIVGHFQNYIPKFIRRPGSANDTGLGLVRWIHGGGVPLSELPWIQLTHTSVCLSSNSKPTEWDLPATMAAPSTTPLIHGSLKFLEPTEELKYEKPYMSSVPFHQDDARTSNFAELPHDVPITDVRGNEAGFTIDANGFQYIKHHFQNQPYEKIEGPDHPYMVEVGLVLKEIFNAKDVVVYDCNVRSSKPPLSHPNCSYSTAGSKDWRLAIFSGGYFSAYW